MYIPTRPANGLEARQLPTDMLLAGPPALVRHLLCTERQRAEVSAVTGSAMPADSVRDSLETAIREAVHLAETAAAALEPSHRTATIEELFHQFFGLPTTHIPRWRPPAERWNLGGVVRTRLRHAAKILHGGEIHYSCWGWPWTGAEATPPAELVLQARSGRYRIGLGGKFWGMVVAGELPAQGAVLLGAALRIYYGPRVTLRASAPRTVRAYCYMAFALSVAGRPVPAWLRDYCNGDMAPTPPAAPSRARADEPSAPPPAAPPAPPIRLFPTDEEMRRILGYEPVDSLQARLDWMIRQTPPTPRARPSMSAQFWKRFDEGLDRVLDRLPIPTKARPYIRQAARGAVTKGAGAILDAALDATGVMDPEARQAIRQSVEVLLKPPH